MSNQKGWKELCIGGLIDDAGNASKYKVGGWRTYRPVWKPKNCIHCLFCWIFCPDSAIKVNKGKMIGIDYDRCKGCGICATECPAKETAIEMKLEEEFSS